jgi:hypothetical protein
MAARDIIFKHPTVKNSMSGSRISRESLRRLRAGGRRNFKSHNFYRENYPHHHHERSRSGRRRKTTRSIIVVERKSIDSNDERLYEEPCSNIDLIEEVKEEDDDEDDMEEKPPELPLKVGKKITNEENHSYDIPKPIKVLENSPEDYDIPRMKISEMTAILSNINLVSPEEKKKIVMKVKRVEEEEELVESPKKQSKPSPVRKWFKKRIMREKKISKSPELVDNNEYEENEEEMFASVKGSKVNMIINQLEKTGQLKTLSKGLKSRKSLVYDNEEYETVCVKHS